jgi:hypothetical protein
MKLVVKFLVAELVWATGIFVLMAAIAGLSSDPPSTLDFVRWLARSIGLAAFPAGIAVAPVVFADERPLRQLLRAVLVAISISVFVFVLTGLIAPLVSDESRPLSQVVAMMNSTSESWETRNDAAWGFYNSFFVPLNALFFAAIGVQVGFWGSFFRSSLLQRALYWAVGLGLLISGFAIWDTTYETVVLHTAGDASFAAFYTILIPASICAGIGLPTIARLQSGELRRL